MHFERVGGGGGGYLALKQIFSLQKIIWQHKGNPLFILLKCHLLQSGPKKIRPDLDPNYLTL